MYDRQEATDLFAKYQFFWYQTASVQKRRTEGRYVASPRLNPERYKLFCDLIDWCRQHDMDPGLWVFVLFRSRNWQFAPQLARGHLISEKMREGGKYQKTLDRGTLDGYRNLAKGVVETEADPNRDLIPLAETKKRIHAQKATPHLCMAVSTAETFGYHPESQWCQKCPLKAQCLAHIQALVPFDILALREGRITVAQARASS